MNLKYTIDYCQIENVMTKKLIKQKFGVIANNFSESIGRTKERRNLAS